MARTKADAARGSGATEKGPLWCKFKELEVGRMVQRPRDGRRGVVLFPTHHICHHKLTAFCMVKWDDAPDTQEPEVVPTDDVKEWMLDEFANMLFVPPGILDYQENNWHPLTDSFQRRRDPPLQSAKNAPSSSRAAAAQDEAGPSNKPNKGKKQEAATAPPAPLPRNARETRATQAPKAAATPPSGRKAPAPKKRAAAAAPVEASSDDELTDSERAAPATGDEGAEEDEDSRTVLCISTNRSLPADLCLKAGDKRLDQIAEEEYDGDYVVERIMDEVMDGKKKFYLVKWKGFELNVGGDERRGKGDWEPEANLKGCEAFETWQKKKPDWWLAQENVAPPKAVRSRKKARR